MKKQSKIQAGFPRVLVKCALTGMFGVNIIFECAPVGRAHFHDDSHLPTPERMLIDTGKAEVKHRRAQYDTWRIFDNENLYAKRNRHREKMVCG